MSKIICDLCGTSYPETEDQCPICGTARTDSAKQSDIEEKAAKFAVTGMPEKSEKQVPKKKEQPKKKQTPPPAKKKQPEEENRSNWGLIVVVVILLLAIICVCVFIAAKYIDLENPNNGTTSTPVAPSNSGTSSTPAVTIPCTEIRLNLPELTFDAINETILLSPEKVPANATDTFTFESTDPSVATVDASGKVTPVGNGEANIIIRCGEQELIRKVTCSNISIEPPPSSSTSKPVDPPEPPEFEELKLNRTDFTLSGYGSSWNLTSGDKYVGPEDRSAITWTSSDPTVATVTNGKVVAVGNGYCFVTAEYQGLTAKCKVICNNVSEPTDYRLNRTDITMDVDNAPFTLYLYHNDTKEKVAVTFYSKNEKIASVDENGRVTFVGKGTTTVWCEYEGVEYKCTVRVTDKTPEPTTQAPENPPAPEEPA